MIRQVDDTWNILKWNIGWRIDTSNHKQSNADVNSSEPFPKKLWFLEDKDGNLISQDILDAMWSHLLQAFEESQASKLSLLEGSWLKCNPELIKMCYKDMCCLFPELTLCVKNWKAHQFLIVWYSNYSKNQNLRKPGHNDESNFSENNEADTAAIPAKWKNIKKENNIQKKARQNIEPDIARDKDIWSEIPEQTNKLALEGEKCKPFQLNDPLASSTGNMSSKLDQHTQASSTISSIPKMAATKPTSALVTANTMLKMARATPRATIPAPMNANAKPMSNVVSAMSTSMNSTSVSGTSTAITTTNMMAKNAHVPVSTILMASKASPVTVTNTGTAEAAQSMKSIVFSHKIPAWMARTNIHSNQPFEVPLPVTHTPLDKFDMSSWAPVTTITDEQLDVFEQANDRTTPLTNEDQLTIPTMKTKIFTQMKMALCKVFTLY